MDGQGIIENSKDRVDCPSFYGKNLDYEDWRERVEDWLMVKGERVRYPALEIRMALKGKAYEAVKNIDRKKLCLKEGVKLLLNKLDSVYKRESKMDKLNKTIEFFRLERGEKENMRDYIVRHESAAVECEAVGGGKMSNEMKGSHLLYGARLNKTDLHVVLGACGDKEYNYTTIKKLLGNIFQEADSYKSIKKDETWICENRKIKDTQRQGRNYKCYKCEAIGHFAKDCKKRENCCFICKSREHWARECPEKDTHRQGRNYKCYKCEDIGHFAKDCKKRENCCFICQSREHWARECPENWKNRERKEKEVENVLWNNNQRSDQDFDLEIIDGILDTGCNKTVCGEL